MRALYALLLASGVAGMAIGVLEVLRGMRGPDATPFRFEGYGGPGTFIAGLVLAVGTLYLFTLRDRRG